MSNLEARLDALEAVEAVRRLKARYARLCDAGYPPEEIASLFTPDGVWEADRGVGRHVGHQAIRDFFTGMSDEYVWAQHYMLTPEIEVGDGATSAHGTWYLLMPCTQVVNGAPTPRWLVGYYEDDYVLTEDGWRFSSTKLTFEAHVDYTSGWFPNRFAG
jgi:hypothetical protein